MGITILPYVFKRQMVKNSLDLARNIDVAFNLLFLSEWNVVAFNFLFLSEWHSNQNMAY
jgi:hypothetical protein